MLGKTDSDGKGLQMGYSVFKNVQGHEKEKKKGTESQKCIVLSLKYLKREQSNIKENPCKDGKSWDSRSGIYYAVLKFCDC